MNVTREDLQMIERALIGKDPSNEVLGKYNDLLTEIKKAPEAENKNRKETLLRHYATEEPTEFYQFDAYHDNLPPDEGDELSRITTWELMGGFAVRVLIGKGTNKEEAIRLLLKITESIVSSGLEDPEGSKESSGAIFGIGD